MGPRSPPGSTYPGRDAHCARSTAAGLLCACLLLPLAALGASIDATLSGLDLTWDDDGTETDVTLSPAFSPAETSYTATVANIVSLITVDPTKNDDDAGLDYFDGTDTMLTDSDSDPTNGFQTDLAEGTNTIKIKVTAEDDNTTQTYTVKVKRNLAPPESVLVSNIDETTHASFESVAQADVVAQQFTTGSSSYVLTAAQIDVESVSHVSLTNALVRVCPKGTGNFPDTGNCLASLTDPATLGTGVQTFNAPGAGVTLAASTPYFLVVSNDNASYFFTVNPTSSDAEDSEYGWNIANTGLRSSDGTTYGPLVYNLNALKIAILGYDTTSDPAPSTDATLSSLDLTWDSDGTETDIMLSPTFASNVTTYTASVANGVARITVDGAKNDDNAELDYFDVGNSLLADADGDAMNGFQIDLAAGANVVKVKVTAEDGETTETYTVTVTRAAGTILVSSLSQSDDGTVSVGGASGRIVAQQFTVALNHETVLSDVTVGGAERRGHRRRHPRTRRRQREQPRGSQPLRPDPDGHGRRSDGIYTAPPNAALTRRASYFVVIKGPAANSQTVSITSSANQTGESDWTIADSGRSTFSGSGWSSTLALRMQLRGAVTLVPLSTDATLSGLDLTWDDAGTPTDIILSPPFASNVTTYTASVANTVARITVDATENDDGAEANYFDGGDSMLTDADGVAEGFQIDLAAGANVVKVKVTAEDGETTETYTVTVTRAAGTTLVSSLNQSNNGVATVGGSGDVAHAQKFTLPSNQEAVLSDVRIADASGGGIVVAIHEPDAGDANNPATSSLYDLRRTGTPSGDGVFTAPPNAALTRGASYFVVVKAGATARSITLTNSNSETGQSGWTIANGRRQMGSGLPWRGESQKLRMRLRGTATTVQLSTDATLTGLDLTWDNNGIETDITLSPTFASNETSYAASVANTVARVTVDATENDDSAEANYFDGSDSALTDADGDAMNGFQVDLAEGVNTIKIKVTAEDENTTQTYTVVVTRNLAPPDSVLVGNLDETENTSFREEVIANRIVAQEFTTGSSTYVLTAAQIDVESVTGATADPVVRVCPKGTGNFPDTGNCLGALTDPSSFGTGVQTFNAPGAGLTLAAATPYFLVVTNTNSAAFFRLSTTSADNQDSDYGWTIADNGRKSTDGGTTYGNLDSTTTSLKITVLGYDTTSDPASTDATLSDLDLSWEDDGIETDIMLSPTFASNVTTYTASVANGVARITVDGAKNDDNAELDYFDVGNSLLADADGDAMNGFQIDLAAGANVVKVKVTAEDGETTETYTVTVTRAAGTILVSSLSQSDDGTVSVGGASGRIVAQQFTVALNHETVLSDVTVGGASGAGIVVAIHEPDAGNANNPAEASLYDLTRTGTDGSDGIYTAPPNAALTRGAGYFVVVKGPAANSQTVSITSSANQTGESDWTIADSGRRTLGGSGWSSTLALRMQLRGAVTLVPLSTDATLTDLDLTWDNNGISTDIALNPAFDTAEKSYTASVANEVFQITVAPTFSDSNATPAYFDATDTQLTDADGDAMNGFQADLTDGANTVKVEVTAENGIARETYTVVVTRALTPITVGYDPVAYEVTENGTSVTFTVKVTSPADGATRAFSLSAATADGTAVSPGDYGGISGESIQFSSGDVTRTHTVTVVNDTDLEDDETFQSTLSLASSDAVTISAPTATVTIAGRDATGKPTITGVPQVGQTLTAGEGDMADDDTRPANFPDDYTFQWVRTGAVDTEPVDIPGATSATYVPVAADAGKKLRVKVGFTDGSGAEEQLESERTDDAVVAAPEVCAADRPHADWCATMTVGVDPDRTVGNGYNEGLWGTLDDADIEYGGETAAWTVKQIRIAPTRPETVVVTLDDYAPRGAVFDLGDTEFIANAASEQSHSGRHSWSRPAGFGWLVGQHVTVSANIPPQLDTATLDGNQLTLTFAEDLDTNSKPAASAFTIYIDGDSTGANPSSVDTISGKTVTMTLASAVTSGQTVTLDYEAPTTNPLRDESELDAPGFTGLTVTNNTDASTDATLTDLDLTWDKNGVETGITLNPAFDTAEKSYTASVANEVSRITVAPTFGDGNATPAYFDETDSALNDADSDPNNGYQIDLADGANTIKVKVTAEDEMTTETYTVVVTRALTPIAVGYEAVAYEVTENGTSVTLTVKVTSPAAGAPRAFSLTVSTADGTAVSPGDYGGVTGASIQFSSGDVTKTHTVTVVDDTVIEDDETFQSTLTLVTGDVVTVSPATATVTIAGRDATGKPAITGIPQVGQTLTATVGNIADDDTRPANFPDDYTFQWVRTNADDTNPQNISGATSATYVPAAADAGKKIRVKVGFTDGGGAEERLESDGTADAVVAAQEVCAEDRSDADWCATMTVGSATTGTDTYYGYDTGVNGNFGSLDDTTIDYGDDYTVRGIGYADAANDTFNVYLDAFAPRGSVFDIGGMELAADADSETTTAGAYQWDTSAGPGWLVGPADHCQRQHSAAARHGGGGRQHAGADVFREPRHNLQARRKRVHGLRGRRRGRGPFERGHDQRADRDADPGIRHHQRPDRNSGL